MYQENPLPCYWDLSPPDNAYQEKWNMKAKIFLRVEKIRQVERRNKSASGAVVSTLLKYEIYYSLKYAMVRVSVINLKSLPKMKKAILKRKLTLSKASDSLSRATLKQTSIHRQVHSNETCNIKLEGVLVRIFAHFSISGSPLKIK